MTLRTLPPTAYVDPKGEGRAGERWAVLIGVNDYAEVERLQFCSRDMEAPRDQFVATSIPAKHVFLLCARELALKRVLILDTCQSSSVLTLQRTDRACGRRKPFVHSRV